MGGGPVGCIRLQPVRLVATRQRQAGGLQRPRALDGLARLPTMEAEDTQVGEGHGRCARQAGRQ
eukprot:6784303-Pyramimonas_sp.AAC.1